MSETHIEHDQIIRICSNSFFLRYFKKKCSQIYTGNTVTGKYNVIWFWLVCFSFPVSRHISIPLVLWLFNFDLPAPLDYDYLCDERVNGASIAVDHCKIEGEWKCKTKNIDWNLNIGNSNNQHIKQNIFTNDSGHTLLNAMHITHTFCRNSILSNAMSVKNRQKNRWKWLKWKATFF